MNVSFASGVLVVLGQGNTIHRGSTFLMKACRHGSVNHNAYRNSKIKTSPRREYRLISDVIYSMFSCQKPIRNGGRQLFMYLTSSRVCFHRTGDTFRRSLPSQYCTSVGEKVTYGHQVVIGPEMRHEMVGLPLCLTHHLARVPGERLRRRGLYLGEFEMGLLGWGHCDVSFDRLGLLSSTAPSATA